MTTKLDILGADFESCPVCGEKHNIRRLSITTLCDSCGWDSSNAFVDSGAFDRLIFAYETMLADTKRKAAAARIARREQRRIAV